MGRHAISQMAATKSYLQECAEGIMSEGAVLKTAAKGR
jgi:hypothetical protein